MLKIKDFLENKEVLECINTFINVCDRRDRLIVKLQSLLKEPFPVNKVDSNGLQSSKSSTFTYEMNAEKLFKYMKKSKLDVKVDHLSYRFKYVIKCYVQFQKIKKSVQIY